MYQKVTRVGNSLCVSVPAKFVRTLGLKAGGVVKADVDRAKCQITYTFISPAQLPLLSKNQPA